MKTGIQRKILLLFAIVSMAVLVFASILFAFLIREDKLQSIYHELDKQLVLVNFALTTSFSGYEEDIINLSHNKIVAVRDDEHFTSFLNADESSFQYNYTETEQEIINLFASYEEAHAYINSVYMGRENGSFVRSHPRASPTQYDPRKRPWYILARENPGRVMRTAPYKSVTTDDINIGIVTALLDEKAQVYGVIGMDMTLPDLTNYIKDVNVSFNGQMLLLDSEGVVLVSQQQIQELQCIRELRDDGWTTNTSGKTYLKIMVNSEENYLFIYKSPELNWILAFLIPVHEIDNVIVNTAIRNIAILVLAIVLLGLALITGLRKYVVNPIKVIHKDTQYIRHSGDYNHHVSIRTSDELGQMTQSFNDMMDAVRSSQETLKNSYDKLRRLFEETVNALASTTEFRDPYTAGHQQRVAKLAVAIAQRMQLPDEQIHAIRMAAILHDIGKINIPSEILSKPVKLNPIEMQIIRTHPVTSHEILKKIDFPWPIHIIALQHHERLDGSGYPSCLKGNDICLESRILAVADVVEAMASHRPYRSALGLEAALAEVSQNRGILYDAAVVDACLAVFFENQFSFD